MYEYVKYMFFFYTIFNLIAVCDYNICILFVFFFKSTVHGRL